MMCPACDSASVTQDFFADPSQEWTCDDCGHQFGSPAVTEEEAAIRDPWDTDEFNYAEWVTKGELLNQNHRRSNWEIGDWLLEGEPYIYPLLDFEDLPARGGQRKLSREELRESRIGSDVYSEAEKIFPGKTRNTLKDLASTAKRVPASVRTDKLDWSYHRSLVNLLPNADEATLKQWLDRAIENKYKLREFEKALKGTLPPKEPTKSKPFRVTVPLRTYETLRDLARGQETTYQKVASKILEKELDTPEMQVERTIQKENADQRLHDRRSEVARKWVMKNDPLGLQRGKEYDH